MCDAPTPEVPQCEAGRALHVRHKPPGGGDEHVDALHRCEPHPPAAPAGQQQAAEQRGIQRPPAGVPHQAERAVRGEQARGREVGVAAGGGEGGGFDGQ